MRICIASASRKIAVRLSAAWIGAMCRSAAACAPTTLRAVRHLREVAFACLHRQRCAPCATLSSTLPLLYASKDSPAC
ncbi:hypothetical protein XavaCFBP5823_06975 [Xanthomonas axonopodis pv. vasculorum]|nr:hypothetical protein XavaCFBP5823_06975 [Xanthomonas axonopodis pv. vasculorum]